MDPAIRIEQVQLASGQLALKVRPASPLSAGYGANSGWQRAIA